MGTYYQRYLKIKNKYCIAYNGPFDEFIIQLLHVKPMIETQFPDLEVSIACRDELSEELPGTISKSKMIEQDYPYIRSLQFDMIKHPVMQLIEESKITILPQVSRPTIGKNCLLCPVGVPPVKNLTVQQIEDIKSQLKLEGFTVEIGTNTQNKDLVVGVECKSLYTAACNGTPTRLIDTGFGTEFYKILFPESKILKPI